MMNLWSSFLFLWLVGTSTSPLQSIQNHLKPYKKFRVDFVQQVHQEKLPIEEREAKGHVKFSRSNEFEWVYESPEKKVMSFDGKLVRVDGEEVSVGGGPGFEQSFGFLWGEVDSSTFAVEVLSPRSFRLTPKEGIEANFVSIDVVQQGGIVVSAELTDHEGGRSHLGFRNWKFE